MGNALRYLHKNCCQPTTTEPGGNDPHGGHGQTAGVSALSRDLRHFEATHQVPVGLRKYVVSSKKAQANWYNKLMRAWKEAKPTPKTPEDAARLIVLTLKDHKKEDIEGLLAFYGFPLSHTHDEISPEVPSTLPDGVKYEFHTLPVDVKSVSDGDTVNVYVSTKDPREVSSVPREVKAAALERAKARAVRDYVKADALHKKITDQNYRVINVQNEEVLARKYRIRLRGIDAPEGEMPYGKQAKEELANLVLGKCLRVLVYGDDQYGRLVADIYCNGVFVQEMMLKKGLAWHYAVYDRRPELAKWEKEARAKRVGLWASRNPEEPWDWRKNKRNGNH